MIKNISKLGSVINKSEQKKIKGGRVQIQNDEKHQYVICLDGNAFGISPHATPEQQELVCNGHGGWYMIIYH